MPSCASVSVSGSWAPVWSCTADTRGTRSRASVSRADAALRPCSSWCATVTPSPIRSRTTSCSVTNPAANTRRISAAVAGQTWRRYHPAKRRGVPARRSPGAAGAAGGASGAGVMRSSMPTHCTARVRDGRPASCRRRARSAQLLLAVVADDATHDVEEALGEALGVGVVGALRVHVKDRLIGVGQQLHPSSVAPQLDAVHEADLAVVVEVALQVLGGRAHDRALERPGAGDSLVHEGAGGDLRDLLAERPRLWGQQLEQLAEAHDGVERRQELGEDVAAPEGAGEDHAVLGRRLRQDRQRDLGAPHLDAELSGKLFGEARDGERQHDLLALARVLRHKLDVQQQRLLERHLVATLVDDVDALRPGTDDDAHVGLHGSHQALYLLDVGAQPRSWAPTSRRYSAWCEPWRPTWASSSVPGRSASTSSTSVATRCRSRRRCCCTSSSWRSTRARARRSCCRSPSRASPNSLPESSASRCGAPRSRCRPWRRRRPRTAWSSPARSGAATSSPSSCRRSTP